ncbi:uncharacterized [Tachysurus ichikawai]
MEADERPTYCIPSDQAEPHRPAPEVDLEREESQGEPSGIFGWAIGTLRVGNLKSQRGHKKTQCGPSEDSGWAIRRLRVGHQKTQGGPSEDSGWAIGSLSVGFWESRGGPSGDSRV